MDSKQNASVLVVKPKTLNAADKASLRKAGIVVVEAADPSDVRFLSIERAPLDSSDLFYAAMTAVASDKYSGNTQQKFAEIMGSLVKASRGVK